MDAGQPSPDHLAQVDQQVPAVGDLDRLRGAQADAAGVLGRAVPCHHLDGVVFAQPSRQGLRSAVGQEIDNAARFQVDQNGPVGLPLPERPVVDPQDARRTARGQWDGAHEAQHAVGAGRHTEVVKQAGAGLTTAGDPNLPLSGGEPPGATRPGGQQVRQRFGESPARAGGVPAVEPADQEVKANRAAEAGQIGRTAAVATMDGLAEDAAVRAGRAGLRRLGGNLDSCRAGVCHLLDAAAWNQKQLIHSAINNADPS